MSMLPVTGSQLVSHRKVPGSFLFGDAASMMRKATTLGPTFTHHRQTIKDCTKCMRKCPHHDASTKRTIDCRLVKSSKSGGTGKRRTGRKGLGCLLSFRTEAPVVSSVASSREMAVENGLFAKKTVATELDQKKKARYKTGSDDRFLVAVSENC